MTDTTNQMYIVSLRTLPIWPNFQDNPDRFPSAGRIQDWLAERGVIFGPEGYVNVGTDGSVFVYSVTDPTAAWNSFDNSPTAEESLLATRLGQAATLVNKLANGTATPAEKDAGLRLALLLILRLYQREA